MDDLFINPKEASGSTYRSHFTFEMYAPNSVSESGAAMTDRVSIQFSGEDLSTTDIVAKFEDFLKAAGYVFDGKYLDLVEK
jgi:hypothetical protein